ncbi:MAG: PAS domain-containing protein [Anaerolineae bacterium]
MEVGINTSLCIEEYEQLLEQLPAMIWRANQRAECSYCSQSWRAFTGVSRLGIGWLEPIHPEDRHKYMSAYRGAVSRWLPFEVQYRLRRHDGAFRWVLDRAAPTHDGAGRFDGYVGICVDVTGQVEAARAEQTRLRGLLPICAHCKSIRDDRGYWHSVEAYMSEHTDADLSHGICPECMKKLYPEFQDVQEVVRTGVRERTAHAAGPAASIAQSVASAAAAKLAAAFESVSGGGDKPECAACAGGAGAG